MPPEAAPSAEARVPIRAPDGELGTVPASELAGALDSGAEQVSPQVIAEAEAAKAREERYGGLSGAAAAAGLGAGRGLTFGLSDVAAVGLGGDAAREAISGYRDVNPGSSLTGEIAGVVGPALLSGGSTGLASVARGASVIPRGAGAAARLAERGMAGLVGEGAAGLGGRVLQRGLATGAGAAVEGALYGVGQELSDAAIENHELTGERLVAGAGKGALFGGLLGAGLGAGSGAIEKAGEGLAATLASKGGADGIPGLLRKHAEEEAFRATGVKMKNWQLLGKTAEERAARAREVGSVLLDEGIVHAGATKTSMAEQVAVKAEEQGKKLGDMVKRLDAAESRMSPEAFLARAEAEVLAPLARTPGLKAEEAAVRSYLDDFAAKTGVTARQAAAERAQGLAAGIPAKRLPPMPSAAQMATPSFEDLNAFRKAFDGKLKWDSLPNNLFNPGATDQLRKIRAILEDEFTKAGEQAAQQMGGTFAAEYKSTKELFSKLAEARGILKKEAGREEFANRAISLTDTMAGLTGMSLAGPAGLALGVANKLIRTRGNQVAADLLNRASSIQAIQKATSARAARLTAGVRDALLTTGVPAAVPLAERATISPKDARRIAGDVKAVSLNDAAKTTRISTFVGGELGAHAPKVEASALATANRAMSFLAAKAPVGRVDQHSLTPHLETPRYSDAEIHKFARYLEGVEGGAEDLVEKLKRGVVDREAIEAVQAVYPGDFEELRFEFRTQISELSAEGKIATIPYQKRLQLGTLLDVPADDSMDKSFVSAMQATKESPADAEAASDAADHGNFAARPANAAAAAVPYMTNADKAQMGGQ